METHKTTPVVRRLSGTHKREFNLWFSDRQPFTHDCNSYWDGGSRDTYTVLDMNGQFIEFPPSGSFNKLADPYVIRPGTLLMNTGVFRGKPTTVCFYGHESDRPWILMLLGVSEAQQ